MVIGLSRIELFYDSGFFGGTGSSGCCHYNVSVILTDCTKLA